MKYLYNDNPRNSHRLGVGLGTTEGIQKHYPKIIQQSQYKLFQQNLLLKRKINQLQDQMRKQKTQIETNRKTAQKLRKKMNLQFQKELYWQKNLYMDNNYMVLGVKNQYQKLKESYNNKCNQIDNLKKIIKYTQMQQTNAELEAYKSETNRLKSQIDKLVAVYKIPTQINSLESKTNQFEILDIKKQMVKYHKLQQQYAQKLNNLNKILEEKEIKIQFLQKLIIEKENVIYKNQQIIKRVTQEKDRLKHNLDELKLNVHSVIEKQHKTVQQIKIIDRKHFDKETHILQNQIQQKNQYILKLQKELSHINSLVSQHKKPDQKMYMSLNYQIQKSISLFSKEKLIPIKKERTSSSVAQCEQQFELQNFPISQFYHLNKEQSSKHHYTLKRNKVKQEDIKQICLQIKYRLLFHGVNINDAKELLNNGKDTISIKQILEKLKESPFSITGEQKRILFARYLIQDQTQSIIYYQQSRTSLTPMVLSIFIHIIPKFQVLNSSQLENVKIKIIDMVSKYKISLTQAVTQYNKSMIITLNKFLEILTQQELNIGENYTNYMVMEMLSHSADINNLQFKYLLALVPL